MAKRFTETNKWNDPWFRKLKAGEKLVFLYLIDNCDNAGFYEVDCEMMSFQIGIESSKIEGAIKGISRGLLGAGTDWVWVKNFLKHQKNWPLNPENNAHKQIINILISKSEMFKNDKNFKEILGAVKGLLSPIGIGKGNGSGKGNSKGKVKEVEFTEFLEYAKTLDVYHISFDFQLQAKYNSWKESGWKDGNNKKIVNWKTKLQNTMPYFKKDLSITNQENKEVDINSVNL